MKCGVSALAKINYEKLKSKIIKNIGQANWMNLRTFCGMHKYVEDKMSATLYSIFIVNPDKENGLTEKEVLSIANTLRNTLRKYPHVRIFIVKSTRVLLEQRYLQRADTVLL